MKFYIQTSKDGYITDCITYPYNGYIETEFETPLPDMFIAGCYKYLGDNNYELDEDKCKNETDEILNTILGVQP